MAADLGVGVHVVAKGALRRGKQIARPGIVLMGAHGAVVGSGKDQKQAHHHGQNGVIIIRDGAQEHGKAVDAGAFRHRGGHRSGPAGHRCNDADGRSGGVDEIGQLCPGNILPVGHRAHHRAHGQAVEIVVHKDQHAQHQGGQLRPGPGVDVAGGPPPKGGAAAGFVHQCHQDAQHHQKYQDAYIGGVGQLVHHAPLGVEEQGVYRQLQVAVGVQQCAGCNAHQQRGVDLFGDQRQYDGDHRGQQAEHCAVYSAGIVGRIGDLAGGGSGAHGQQAKHQQGSHPGQVVFFHGFAIPLTLRFFQCPAGQTTLPPG